jgi:hypothetical protein
MVAADEDYLLRKSSVDDWTNRSTLGVTPEVDELARDLAEHGLAEVRG